jgi:hypothetical protein
MLALYSSGRFVRAFADARGGAGQSDASSVFLWQAREGIRRCQRGVRGGSQMLALVRQAREGVRRCRKRGRGSQVLALYSSGRLVRVLADAREGAGAVRC